MFPCKINDLFVNGTVVGNFFFSRTEPNEVGKIRFLISGPYPTCVIFYGYPVTLLKDFSGVFNLLGKF